MEVFATIWDLSLEKTPLLLWVLHNSIRLLLDTPGTRAAFQQGHFDFVLSHTPLGRFEQPEDVNGLIVFLCSDEAAFINGAAINIGGGISMH